MDSIENSPRGVPNLQFDPDKHPHATLKAFNDFIEQYEFRYQAQYPEPSKSSLDNAVLQWKSEHGEAEPTAAQKLAMRNDFISKDKVRKLLGFFATLRLQQDWKAAEPEEANRNCSWKDFLTKMRNYYKPTENSTLRNYEFHNLMQLPRETFGAFANRVEKEGKTCSFCDCDATSACNACEMAIRDQIVIGTNNEKIRERALLKSWKLGELRTEGLKLESASRGGETLSQSTVNKVGKYSYKNLEKFKESKHASPAKTKKLCFRCGEPFFNGHMKNCAAIKARCSGCKKIGHFQSVCKSSDDVNATVTAESEQNHEEEDTSDTYTLNIWRIKTCHSNPRFQANKNKDEDAIDFHARVLVKNKLVNMLADTGAKVSVIGMKQAKDWGLLSLLQPSSVKIRPYQSAPIPVRGKITTAVTFGSTTIPVEFQILPGSCEPILAGAKAAHLGILVFQGDAHNHVSDIYAMIDNEEADTVEGKEFYTDIQNILTPYPHCFAGIGHLKDHLVKFYVDDTIKPVVVPRRPIPYHLVERVDKAIQEMLEEDVIELQPLNEPAPWVSAPVIVTNPDGSLRITLDARNINKAIQGNNSPIPRMEEIKSQLSGSKYFSKMDLKSAFWQLELHPDIRYLTVFECNGKLYRYKRLLMGVKPAQGELNMALRPIFDHISNVFLIHDDLIIAAKSRDEHNKALAAVMEAISNAGITFNPSKCVFGKKEIKFWGMIVSEEGVRPDPAKVDALENLPSPKNKEELKSFICMMQSNSDFICQFSQKIAPLRKLLKNDARFQWSDSHQAIFEDIISAFRKDTLLRYFDLGKQTYVFVDAHKSGLCAILAQGDSVETAKPVDIKSRCTNKTESSSYPQLDLEGMAVDFALRRFRQYLIGAPTPAIIVTDHKPLLGVFNGRRSGSIRTETIKMRHQNIQYELLYRKGSDNSADFLSRHAQPWESLPKTIQAEAEEVTNLLYTLRLSPIMDALGIPEIASATAHDPVLSKLQRMIKEGKTFIPKQDPDLAPFKQIFSEITYLPNGTLVFQDRIILPPVLHKKAIQLAHMGAHPGQNGLLRRLRSHFYMLDLDKQVKDFVENCLDCQTFTDKNMKEPIQPNKVPERCWEEVSVDLFGPLPSSHHIVVIQDLASRFPIAKVVKSTNAKNVIPVLADTYNVFGNPKVQKSDNGPPFNSKEMEAFAQGRNIEQVKIPPGHPAANNVETVMKPLGKAMKIGFHHKSSENDALQAFLQTYRDTPHSSTKVTPAAMLFRDGYRSNFPRKSITEDEVRRARGKDSANKNMRKEQYNSSRHSKASGFQVGHQVLVRNFHKNSKYEPYFLPERYTVVDTMAGGKIILVQSSRTGRYLKRHPNDLKKYDGYGVDADEKDEDFQEGELLRAWREAFESIDSMPESDTESTDRLFHRGDAEPDHPPDHPPAPAELPLRRSARVGTQNRRYHNEDFVTNCVGYGDDTS